MNEAIKVDIVVAFIDVPSAASRQYWTRETTARCVPRVGDEVPVPGPSSVPVCRVIWEPDLHTVHLVLQECSRELIRAMLAVFNKDEPEVVESILNGEITDWMERDGWKLRGPRSATLS